MPAAKEIPSAEDLGKEIQDLKAELANLRAEYGTAMGLDSISRGLSNIAELMAPLRHLVPPVRGEPLDRCTGLALAGLQAALARPRWTGVGSLGICEPSLGYIGQADCADNTEPEGHVIKSGETS